MYSRVTLQNNKNFIMAVLGFMPINIELIELKIFWGGFFGAHPETKNPPKRF